MSAPEFNAGELVPSVSIEGLLAQRDALLAKVGHAIDTLHEAARITTQSGIGREYRDFGWMIEPEHRYRTSLLEDDSLAEISKRVDAAAWNHLMHESGLLTFMDSKAREQWREKIDKCDTPALTRENIGATFAALYEARGDMFERGVIACFRSLSWDYKTNNPVKFGKRIVKYLGQSYLYSGRGDELNDLQRVLCVLDGKPEEDHRNSLLTRLEVARRPSGGFGHLSRGELDDAYVHVRWFKNGNGHITFKRPDLVERMNGIIAKHYPDALPEPRI